MAQGVFPGTTQELAAAWVLRFITGGLKGSAQQLGESTTVS
jgi:hypothetical protein